MKLKIDRELLALKLNKAIKFTPDKQIIPAFENFLLFTKEGKINIIATDGNIQIHLQCPVKTDGNVAICVPAKLFLKTVNLFRENEVLITIKSDTKIEVKCGKAKYNITLDCMANDFPVMLSPASTNEIAINQFLLSIGLKSTQRFVDEKNVNANMAAINIAEINDKIVFIGLTQVLFCRAAIKPISINKWEKVSILPDTANKVDLMLGEKGEVNIIHDDKRISFSSNLGTSDSFEIISVVANAKFPSPESAYARQSKDMLVVNTMELSDAMKRLRLYVEEGSVPIITISNTENSQELKLTSADNLTHKDGEEIISIINPSEVIINRSMKNDDIIKVLSVVDAAEVKLFLDSGKKGPTSIVPVVNTDDEDIFNFLIGSVGSV